MRNDTPRLVALVILVGASIITAACRSNIDRAAADTLAQVELEKYSEAQGLALSNFSRAEVTDHGTLWLYSYEYAGPTEYLLGITVHKDGQTEVSRMIEGQKAW